MSKLTTITCAPTCAQFVAVYAQVVDIKKVDELPKKVCCCCFLLQGFLLPGTFLLSPSCLDARTPSTIPRNPTGAAHACPQLPPRSTWLCLPTQSHSHHQHPKALPWHCCHSPVRLSNPTQAVFCRCWRSATFPMCNGAHAEHNKVTLGTTFKLAQNECMGGHPQPHCLYRHSMLSHPRRQPSRHD